MNKKNIKKKKKDIKKLYHFFSIINLDTENNHPISQLGLILEEMSDEERKQMILVQERQIKACYGKHAVDEFKKS